MQDDDVLELGDLLARAIGTALIVTGEVSEVAGAFRHGAKDYLRHMAGSGAAYRGYFGGRDGDLDSEFAVEGIRETFRRDLAGESGCGQRWNEEIRAEACFDSDAGDIDFAVVLDSFMRGR
jgi:hypothetical protein